jgi:hypothetical protein
VETARFAHKIALALQAREAALFRKGIPEAAARQRELLRGYLRGHADTALGHAYGLGGISGYEEFAARVPLLDYEAHRPYIDGIAAGKSGLLHPGKTLFLEETSGSTGGAKLIPYGRALQGEFQRGLSSWMHALAAEHPSAFRGKMYWSLSPALRPFRRTEGGIPIGVEGDIGYFDPLKALLLKAVMAVPDSLRKVTDADAFYRATLLSLLTAPSLSFISCWSPSFFLQLDRFLQSHREEIVSSLRILKPSDKKRANGISRRIEILGGAFTWKDLLPDLACLSCWTHASSALWLDGLRARLGAVPVQGKGLLSTECFVSFPFEPGLDPVLAYRSHFFEFREWRSSEGGAIVPMEGLRAGETYEVIATTGGGLCRYPTGDVVEVTSLAAGLPSLRFLGRRNGWTDMAGEKVSEPAALLALQELRRDGYPEISGAALVACAEAGSPGRPRYRLHVEAGDSRFDDEGLNALATAMERRLESNPYYRQARALGQLEKLEVEILEPGSMERLLTAYKRRRRVSDGNAKLPFLFSLGDWLALREEHVLL